MWNSRSVCWLIPQECFYLYPWLLWSYVVVKTSCLGTRLIGPHRIIVLRIQAGDSASWLRVMIVERQFSETKLRVQNDKYSKDTCQKSRKQIWDKGTSGLLPASLTCVCGVSVVLGLSQKLFSQRTALSPGKQHLQSLHMKQNLWLVLNANLPAYKWSTVLCSSRGGKSCCLYWKAASPSTCCLSSQSMEDTSCSAIRSSPTLALRAPGVFNFFAKFFKFFTTRIFLFFVSFVTGGDCDVPWVEVSVPWVEVSEVGLPDIPQR